MENSDRERYRKEKETFEASNAKPDSKKLKRSSTSKKDPDAPKRAMSAFFFYQQERRSDCKAEFPSLSHTEIIKVRSFKFRK
jgi:hypothetical protein